MKKYKLMYLLTSAALIGSLSGCGSSSGSGDASGSEPISINTFTNLPDTMVTNQTGVFEALINTGAQAAKVTLGAGEAGTKLTAVDFPTANGVTWTQIENTTGLPDCKPGLTLSSAQPSCAIKALIASDVDGASINGDLEVKTDSQSIKIPVKIEFVGAGNTKLPMANITDVTAIAPDTTTTITLLNPSENSSALNNVKLALPIWLGNLIQNVKGGILIENLDGSKSILYAIDGRATNLSPGQSAQFSFDIPGTEDVTEAILGHYAELTDNPTSSLVSVEAANLRNTLKPNLEVSIEPGKFNTNSITLLDPAVPQTLTFKNLANTALTIGGSGMVFNLHTGVSQTGGTCQNGLILNANGNAGDSCTITLSAETSAKTSTDKSITLSYSDHSGNSFSSKTNVNVDSAHIAIGDIGADNILATPKSAPEVVHVSITNTGKFNWTPSNLPENYIIGKQGQSIQDPNINVLGESLGSSCLSGVEISPGASCDLAIEATSNMEAGSYTLTLTPSENLVSQKTKNFSVRGQPGEFQFRDDSGSEINSANIQIGNSKTVTLRNIGQTPISTVSIAVESPLSKSDDSCDGNTLAENTSCQFTIMAPNGAGAAISNLNVAGSSESQSVSHAMAVTIEGVNLSFTPLSGISIPSSGSSITEVVISNTSSFDWHPSTKVDDYQISGTNTSGITIVGTGLTKVYCLSGAAVPPGGSCSLGLQVDSNANVGSYSLNLRQANNLSSPYQIVFDVINNLGFVSFNPSSATIGKGTTPTIQTITVNNSGNSAISNFYIAEPSEVTTTASNCGTALSPITLAANSSCSFGVSADNSVLDGTYSYVANGDAENCANCGTAQIDVTVSGVTVTTGTIGDSGSIRRPAVGNQITNVTIINNNVQTAWEPATNSTNYEVSCVADGADTCATNNVTIVAPTTGLSCLSGADVAPGSSCNIGIQTNENSTRASYNLIVKAHKNLSNDSVSAAFNIDSSLGYLSYSSTSTGSGLNTVTSPLNLPKRTSALEASPIINSITVENKGDTEITGLTLNTSAQSADLTLSNNTCATTLAAHSSCTFDLEVANIAGEYTFTSGADEGSLSNNNASFKAAVGCAYSGVCRVFTSYSVVSGDNNTWMLNKGTTAATGTTPVAKANNICANDQNNPNDGGIFKAWLSDSGTDAKDNIGYHALLSYTANWNYNLPIARTGTLLSGNLVNAINDPRASNPGAGVKAATNVNGTFTGLDNFASCNNWTSVTNSTPASGAGAKANWGRQAFTNGNWTAYIYGDGGNFNSSCDATYARPIYCFEAQS